MAPIKTALLSFGMSGKIFHAPFLHLHPGFALTGAWERSNKIIESLYPGVTSYPSYEAILQDPDIQLVVVNTPNYTHFEYAKAALLAGKHIVVEKAFTTTVSEAEELKRTAERMNRQIAVFQSRRWDSDFKTVQQVLAVGALGEVVEASLRFDRFRPSLSAKIHKEHPHPGSGLLFDLGPHLADQAICLFGMPQAVFADVRVTRQYSQVDDWFNINLYYPNQWVSLRCGFFMRAPLPAFTIHGKMGSFIKSRADVQEDLLLAGNAPNLDDWGTEPELEQGWLYTDREGIVSSTRIPSQKGNYYYFYDEVYTALTTGTAMPVTCDDGIRVMKVLEAAVKSNEERKVIAL